MEFYADDLVPWLENQTSNLATGSAIASVTIAMDALVPSSNTHLQTLRNHLRFLGLFEFIRLGSAYDFIMNKHSFDSWMNTSSDSGTYNSTSSYLDFSITTSTFWFFFLNINSMEIICDLYSQWCGGWLGCRKTRGAVSLFRRPFVGLVLVVGSNKAKGRRVVVGRNREMGLRLLIVGEKNQHRCPNRRRLSPEQPSICSHQQLQRPDLYIKKESLPPPQSHHPILHCFSNKPICYFQILSTTRYLLRHRLTETTTYLEPQVTIATKEDESKMSELDSDCPSKFIDYQDINDGNEIRARVYKWTVVAETMGAEGGAEGSGG
ncbi:unnamed protein product [Lactuca saligna]|uniref:Uncharacterized protein n=1 Tax=Lactuca saligna TaxID=75948 RepID=A0AA35Z5S8_LACSI|nr:unnamed protein product [Lactuca saligna]